MNNKQPYREWVGVVLGMLLAGAAHFLSGQRAAGLKWYISLFACGVVGVALLATPGMAPFILGLAIIPAGVVLWLVMLKQSYRPVQRIGIPGWLTLIVIAIVLRSGSSFLARQFIHPFKVPTGTMQPTIFGTHARSMPADSCDKPGFSQWLLSGQRYLEVKAESSGTFSAMSLSRVDPSWLTCRVGSRQYELPRFAPPLKQPGEQVSAGDTLWAGIVTAGDHVFIERISYLFSKPKRGDIVVFRTEGIPTLPPGTFYIKRIAGLPGERIRIAPPFLIVNGHEVMEPPIFKTISTSSGGYAGFQLAGPVGGRLSKPTDEITLGPHEYLVLGDNTQNSFDSRFWGAVPERNILGRVTRIYWPFTRISALEGK